MNPVFSLRPATSDDLKWVMSIEENVHRAPWTLEHFQSELTKPYSRFLVMTDDETDSIVAGYIVYWMMFEECQILNLAVNLEYRGLGVAQALVRKAVNNAFYEQRNQIVLEVRRSNHPAIHLYQKLNFTISHVRKNFYSDGEDAYTMCLNILKENTLI